MQPWYGRAAYGKLLISRELHTTFLVLPTAALSMDCLRSFLVGPSSYWCVAPNW